VTEKALHVPNVYALFQEVRRHGVAQHVRRHHAPEIQPTRERADASANALRRCRPTAGIHEEGLRGRASSLTLPTVPTEDGRDRERDKNSALPIAFANDRNHSFIEIDGGIRKTGQLAHAHARRKQEFQRHVRGEVAEAQSLPTTALLQEQPQLGTRNDAREPSCSPNADPRRPKRIVELRHRQSREVEEGVKRRDMPAHACFTETAFFEEMLDERVQPLGLAALKRRVGPNELPEMP